MSLLERMEDWLVRKTMRQLDIIPVGHPPSDDGMIALTVFVFILIGVAATCSHCLAR